MVLTVERELGLHNADRLPAQWIAFQRGSVLLRQMLLAEYAGFDLIKSLLQGVVKWRSTSDTPSGSSSGFPQYPPPRQTTARRDVLSRTY